MQAWIQILITSIVLIGPTVGQLTQARGVIHLDTTVSDGDYTPTEMAVFLQENDIEVGIFTDHNTVKWDCGFFPAQWITGKLTGWAIAAAVGRSKSVQSYGAEAYVSEINALNEVTEDVILLPGVEANPFFFWEGSLLFNSLSINNVNKHLLAFGFADAEAYDQIPSVGNGFFRTYSMESLFSLWPIGLIILAFQLLKATTNSPIRGMIKAVGVGLTVLSGLFLTQNFPYAFTRYDQYHGDQGIAPYQDFIDYVDEHNGLVFWAHPEVEVDRTIEKPPLKVAVKTAAYHLDLLYAVNYTGFSAFSEGTKHIIPPGAIWDRVLNEYAIGTRERPIWAIAEGDVEGDHFSPQLSETVFLLEEHTQKGALDALREGRIYAVAGPNAHFFSLKSFSVASELDRAISGSTLTAQPENVTVTARLSFDSPNEERTRIQAILIRDGEPIGNYSGDGILDVSFTEEKTLRKDRIHYYRLDASAPNQTRLLSNPIFLKSGR